MNSLILARYFIYIQFGGSKKWSKFHHNGVMFPPPYIPHKIPIKYNGVNIILPEIAEEYATLYAKYLDTDYVKSKIFNKNFWNDWKKYVKDLNINDFEKCDFTEIHKYIIKEKERKKHISDTDREHEKLERETNELKYKIAFVDGKEQKVGNFKMEPPGIFLGRGSHPKLGKIKKRIYPEDITLNLSKDAAKPELQDFFKNHKWKKIIHDNSLEWLASWKDNITGKVKYTRLGSKSDFQANSDKSKFEKARLLKNIIHKIRNINGINLDSNDQKVAQLATGLYFIDNFALRVGNEKGSDEADTVGVTSLRFEHVELKDNNMVKLDFLGKDSVRYLNEVQVSDQIYRNLKIFLENKKKGDEVFDLITSQDINKYLQTFDENLTAKVFRTYNASIVFQEELNNINIKYETYNKSDKNTLLLNLFNEANIKVAKLCNHQKNISKGYEESLQKIKDKVKEYIEQLKELKKEPTKNKKKIKKIKEYIKTQKEKQNLKSELKNLSLITSKTNYIDPRITIAFAKKHNIPYNKILKQTLLEKFFWAIDVDSNYTF
jgi:DNA topoisomerase-1